MMPSGVRNTRGFCIKDDSEFLEHFAGLLQQEAELFRELDGIQEQALGCMRSGVFGNLENLLQRQREVTQTLEVRRCELQPLLESWERLPASERDTIRQGPIGALLQTLESSAEEIQKRHRDQFDAPAAGGGEDTAAGDIAARVSRYRAGL